jgi:hypothetical protein
LENFDNDHKHHFTAKEKEQDPEKDKRDEILIKCKQAIENLHQENQREK